MKTAIMQPYLFPYIGYFQLINVVDKFVVYDNIEYTKKGWINRNRFLQNGADVFFTVPLKKDSDFLTIRERSLAANFYQQDLPKILARFKNSYSKAPFFKEVFSLVEKSFSNTKDNLFEYIFDSIKTVSEYLELETELLISSEISENAHLRGKERVMKICKDLGAETYINPIGGTEMYSKEEFAENDLQIFFLQTKNIGYPQFKHEFVPHLSIIDVLMFNSKEKVIEFLDCNYELI